MSVRKVDEEYVNYRRIDKQIRNYVSIKIYHQFFQRTFKIDFEREKTDMNERKNLDSILSRYSLHFH